MGNSLLTNNVVPLQSRWSHFVRKITFSLNAKPFPQNSIKRMFSRDSEIVETGTTRLQRIQKSPMHWCFQCTRLLN